MKQDKDERGPIQRERGKVKHCVQFVPTYWTYKWFVSSTSLVFDFGCSFSLVTAKGRQKYKGSVINLNTDGSYLLLSPGLETVVGPSKQSPQTLRDVQCDGGEDEGGGGLGELCGRTPPLGDSASCHWDPVGSKR